MKTEAERGQVGGNAAEIYEEFFVPALFAEWGGRVVDAASVTSGQRVLDVACGTGALARAALERVGADGSVVGLDINDQMLAVAQARMPAVEWRAGSAEALPFEDDSFDVVLSQFGLMFFEDRVAALREMGRVLGPRGRIAVAVWGSLADTPGYSAMVDLLQRMFGDDAANALRAPYVLGDPSTLVALFDEAGLPGADVSTQMGTARFPSIESWMFTIRGWTLAYTFDETQYAQLLAEADRVLQSFVTTSGAVEFAAPAHIVTHGG